MAWRAASWATCWAANAVKALVSWDDRVVEGRTMHDRVGGATVDGPDGQRPEREGAGRADGCQPDGGVTVGDGAEDVGGSRGTGRAHRSAGDGGAKRAGGVAGRVNGDTVG